MAATAIPPEVMVEKLQYITIILLVAIIILWFHFSSKVDRERSKLEELKKENEEAESKIKSVTRLYKSAAQNLLEKNTLVEKLSVVNSDLRRDYQEKEQQVTRLKREVAVLNDIKEMQETSIRGFRKTSRDLKKEKEMTPEEEFNKRMKELGGL